MRDSRNVIVGCLFALCTFVSAFAQTPAYESRAPEPLRGGSPASPVNVRNRCTASPGEGAATAVLAGSDNVSATREQYSECPSPAEASQFAQQRVTERLAVWQQRLKLETWRISVLPARSSELKPRTLGAISWDKGKNTAVIWVLDPADYQLPFREMLDDMELTVVHELVHLKLASLPRSQASRSTEEQAVNGIADALLALDRGKQ
jgi:hypothetical protein